MGKAKRQKRYKIYIQVGNELNYLYSLYPVCCCQGHQVPQHYESYVDAVSVNNKLLSFMILQNCNTWIILYTHYK